MWHLGGPPCLGLDIVTKAVARLSGGLPCAGRGTESIVWLRHAGGCSVLLQPNAYTVTSNVAEVVRWAK